jgi:CHAT domain-containing protein/tetratricopeptide (TPR) repeat protein
MNLKIGNRRSKDKRGPLRLRLSLLPSFFFLLSSFANSVDLRSQFDKLIERGACLESDSRFEEARRSFERTLEVARKVNDPRLMARSLTALASVHIHLNRFERAMSLAQRALFYARNTGDRLMEARAQTQIGNAYFYLDDPAKALAAFESSRSILRKVGKRKDEAGALRDTGVTLRYLGQHDKSFEHLYTALEIYRELNLEFPVASLLQMVGAGYYDLGAHRLALDVFKQALDRARENKDRVTEATVLTSMGYLLMDMAEPERALECFRQSLGVARQEIGRLHEAWTLMGMSSAFSQLGQKEPAIEATRRAIKVHQKIGKSIAQNLRDLGYLYLDSDPKQAIDYFQRALATYGDTRHSWSPYDGLAQAYARLGELDRAIDLYQNAIDRIESIRGRLASGRHRATFAGRFLPVYHRLIESLMKQHERHPVSGRDLRAFSVFERTKARALLEMISQAYVDVGHSLDADLRQKEEQINARIARLQKHLVHTDLTAQERRRLLEGLNDAEREFDNLTVEIKRRNPRLAAWRSPGPLSVDEVQSLLDEKTVLLAYLFTKTQAFAFVITSQAFHVERLAASPALITGRVENLIDLLARNMSGWQDISRRLYAELVAPLRKHFSAGIERLVVVPDGALYYLPFETLVDDAAGRYLLEDFTVSYAPSATVLAQLNTPFSESAPAQRSDLLLFSNPSLAPDLIAESSPRTPAKWTRALYEDEGLKVSPIPFSAAEARAVSRYVGQGSAVYLGDEASERRIKTEVLDRFRIIHFATHGLLSLQSPSRSTLLLSSSDGDGEDGFLQAREIYHLKIASDLVVLSACQTASGRLLAGEGVESLSQAFFYAGAKSVVASLWDVSDRRTANFMETFYRHLADGQSKASALRRAKLGMLSSGPHYWAPFILIGDANQTVDISGRPLWLRENSLLASCILVVIALATACLLLPRQARGSRCSRDC